MDANSQPRDTTERQVLRWQGRVLAGEDLRRSLNGQREVIVPAGTIVTPLAAEQLRANGVKVTRLAPEPARRASAPSRSAWRFAQERPHAAVASAVKALESDGLFLQELTPDRASSACHWARAVAESVARGDCRGAVVFCEDPGLVVCVANKVAGVRAAAVLTLAQANRAARTLVANLAAVELAGWTFFELRQVLRTLCAPANATCPEIVASTLKELDGHAHR